MSALRDFVTYVQRTSPSGPNLQNQGPSLPGQAGPASAGPDTPAAGPGVDQKKGVSFAVYNPGDWSWDVISEGKRVDTSAHSAGAIVQGTTYADYEGWEDKAFTTNYDNPANDIHVTLHVSKRIRGHPKDDPLNNRYVGEVRVTGKKLEFGDMVSARVEGARAIWSNDWDCAGVTFALVIVIKTGPKKGGNRTVRRQITVFANNTEIEGKTTVTPGPA
jgi:hypothetical protein